MNSISNAPFYRTATLRSRFGTTFTSFAKSSRFQKELYEDFVAPHFNAGEFLVETWRHGPGNIDSNCSRPTKVLNVKEISLREEKIEFSTMHDHSKWMVSGDNELICVGDINRQEHQKVRGGGTVCVKQASVAKIYRKSIGDVEPCGKKRKHFYAGLI
jgi:deoxyribonuclease II